MILPFLLLTACSGESSFSPEDGFAAAFESTDTVSAAVGGSLPKCGVLRVSRTSLEVGSTATYYVAKDGATSRLRGSRPVVTTSSGGVLAIVSDGTVKGATVGTSDLIATAKSCVDSVDMEVMASIAAPPTTPPPTTPPPTTPPPTGDGVNSPPPSASAISIQAVRNAGATGSVRVSGGIPLKEGALMPASIANVRVLLGGSVVPAAVRRLSGTYRDGSLRAIAVQTTLTLGTAPVLGYVEITAAPVTQATWNAAVDTNTALLPTDPSYLLSTGMFGRTVPVSASPNPRFEQQFVSNADRLWLADGSDWGTTNYYDRAQSHYVYWARTGDPKWYFRAGAIARDYRRKYVEPNAYNVSPHWSQMEGVALNHWLAADDSSAIAVVRTAARVTGAYTPAVTTVLGADFSEGRIVQRMLLLALLAWELGDTSENWSTKIDAYTNGVILAQRTDGSYAWPNWCSGQANFMTGLQNDGLIKVYERFRADSRILTTVKKSVDYMWSTQWIPASRAFRYASKSCTLLSEGDAGVIAPDLNGLILLGFAWTANKTSDAVMKDRTDVIALGMIEDAWLSGGKQFNQTYYDTHMWLGYR
jgi:hypothetical protein